jgi:hypothetical protein
VRCSCYSVGRPSPSLEWRLDGKLVLGSEDVSVSQVNLENATLRSSLTMRAPAGLTALTCHSSNAAGNTSQRCREHQPGASCPPPGDTANPDRSVLREIKGPYCTTSCEADQSLQGL